MLTAARLFIIVLTVASSASLAQTGIADDEWPQFRGPEGQGRTEITGLPLTWSETENVVWKTPLPGEGHSSPVISGNQIWVTSAIAEKLSDEEMQKRLATMLPATPILPVNDGLAIGALSAIASD